MRSCQKIFIVQFIAATLGILLIVNEIYAGEAAPYTKEAYEKLEEAQKIYKPSYPGKDSTLAEKQKASINMFRDLFKQAGFDFDATIRQIAKDLENKTVTIPKNGQNVITMIIVLLSYVKSHCEYEKVDCLSFFDPKTSEAVQWLWKNTGFKP